MEYSVDWDVSREFVLNETVFNKSQFYFTGGYDTRLNHRTAICDCCSCSYSVILCDCNF